MASVGAGALAGAGLAGRGERRSNGNIYANGGGNGQSNGFPTPSPYNNQGRNGGIEDEDDGMGGRLGGTAIGGGVVTPFVLGRPGAGPAPGRQQSIPVGGYFPSSNMSEKQRLMLAQQQQQQNLQRHPQNLAATHPNLPNPYGTYSPPGGAGGPGVYPSPPPTSVSPTTATFSNEGSGFNAYEGYPASTDHSSSAGTSDGGRSNAMARNAAMGALGAGAGAGAAAGGGGRGYEETESNYSTSASGYGNPSSQGQALSVGQVTEKQREAMAAYTGGASGGGRVVANPDEAAPQGSTTAHSNASHVLVHHDGGRVPQAQSGGGDVDEIPPTYDSIRQARECWVTKHNESRSPFQNRSPQATHPQAGSAGRNYSLQHAMGLPDKREAHVSIMKHVRVACTEHVGIKERINQENKVMNADMAFLQRFENGWLVHDMIRLACWVAMMTRAQDEGDVGEELDLIAQKHLRLSLFMTKCVLLRRSQNIPHLARGNTHRFLSPRPQLRPRPRRIGIRPRNAPQNVKRAMCPCEQGRRLRMRILFTTSECCFCDVSAIVDLLIPGLSRRPTRLALYSTSNVGVIHGGRSPNQKVNNGKPVATCVRNATNRLTANEPGLELDDQHIIYGVQSVKVSLKSRAPRVMQVNLPLEVMWSATPFHKTITSFCLPPEMIVARQGDCYEHEHHGTKIKVHFHDCLQSMAEQINSQNQIYSHTVADEAPDELLQSTTSNHDTMGTEIVLPLLTIPDDGTHCPVQEASDLVLMDTMDTMPSRYEVVPCEDTAQVATLDNKAQEVFSSGPLYSVESNPEGLLMSSTTLQTNLVDNMTNDTSSTILDTQNTSQNRMMYNEGNTVPLPDQLLLSAMCPKDVQHPHGCTTIVDQNINMNSGVFNKVSGDQHFYYKCALNEEENKYLNQLNPNYKPDYPSHCLEGTRQDIILEITQWVNESNTENFLWLSGYPGAGKSTIASTITKYLRKTNRLGAFFTFNGGAGTRLSILWRLVSYELAKKFPLFRGVVVDRLKTEAILTNATPEEIFSELVEKPLIELTKSSPPFQQLPVFVIDGLDECSSTEVHHEKLPDCIERLACLAIPLKWMFTSRYELHFRDLLASVPHIFVDIRTGDNASSQSNEDIRNFFREQFRCMSKDFDMPEPGNDIVEHFTTQARGLFILAVTISRYIAESPGLRLNYPTDEVLASSDLYSLYNQILQRYFGRWKTHECIVFQKFVTIVALSQLKLVQSDFKGIIDSTTVNFILKSLRPVLKDGDIIQFAHQSFVDFLHGHSDEHTAYPLTTSVRCPEQLRIDHNKLLPLLYQFSSIFIARLGTLLDLSPINNALLRTRFIEAQEASDLAKVLFIRPLDESSQLFDLENTIASQRQILSLVPNHDPDIPHIAFSLGKNLVIRFSYLGHIIDLDEAVVYADEPPPQEDDEQKCKHLDFIASMHMLRFKRVGDSNAIDAAVKKLHQLNQISRNFKERHSENDWGLAKVLALRHECTQTLEDREEIISLLQKLLPRPDPENNSTHEAQNSQEVEEGELLQSILLEENLVGC
ncbi:hypothetical protein AB1N83_012195 [Pleurotus pulmonarius]